MPPAEIDREDHVHRVAHPAAPIDEEPPAQLPPAVVRLVPTASCSRATARGARPQPASVTPRPGPGAARTARDTAAGRPSPRSPATVRASTSSPGGHEPRRLHGQHRQPGTCGAHSDSTAMPVSTIVPGRSSAARRAPRSPRRSSRTPRRADGAVAPAGRRCTWRRTRPRPTGTAGACHQQPGREDQLSDRADEQQRNRATGGHQRRRPEPGQRAHLLARTAGRHLRQRP